MLDASGFILRELVASRAIDQADADAAERRAAGERADVCEMLVELGLISHRDLAVTRAKVFEHPFVDLTGYEIDIGNARLLPRSMAESFGAFPLFVVGGVATVAIEDPLDLPALDRIRRELRLEVEPVVCDSQKLRALIARAYSLLQTDTPAEEASATDRLAADRDDPIVAAVNQVIAAGIDLAASDIHLNPDERSLHLRYRVDGVLRTAQGPALAAHASIVQRLKVLAGLDLTQTRKPQDGKFRFAHAGRNVDVRLSLVPTVHGENVVMRLLASAAEVSSIDALGMPAAVRGWFESAVARPHGMILVTGPTGSGKTTTLYAGLSRLNSPERNIMTIEDPVEIRLPLIRQMQVNADIGLTFAAALRSILRQDPDVILVGEIRDEETARIAVQSALTGHLVLSTLHTNDAVGAVPRLRDFGVPPFAINAAVLGAMAQRLVRRVCQTCAVPVRPAPEDLALIGPAVKERAFVDGRGCEACTNSGYRGRLGVFELLAMTPPVRELIDADAPAARIFDAAVDAGMRTMLEDGLEKAAIGLTSIAEVRRVVASDAARRRGPSPAPEPATTPRGDAA